MNNTNELPNYTSPQDWYKAHKESLMSIDLNCPKYYELALNRKSIQINMIETLLNTRLCNDNEFLKDSLDMYEQEYKALWANRNDCIVEWNEYIKNDDDINGDDD